MPHVRFRVRGPKKMGAAPDSFYYPARESRVPHISLAFREMWDSENLNVLIPRAR